MKMVILVPITCHCEPMLQTASQFLLLCISPAPPPLYSALGSAAWRCPFASRLPVVSGQQKATTKTWRNRGERLGSLPCSSCFWAILHQQGHWWWRPPCGSSGRWVLQGAGDTPSTSGVRGKNSGLRLLLSGGLRVHHSECPPGPSLASESSLTFQASLLKPPEGTVLPDGTLTDIM